MSDSVYSPSWLTLENQDRLRAFFWWLFNVFADVRLEGFEQLPAGGCLVTTNHLSWFDAPLIFTVLKGRRVTAFAADKYRGNWFSRHFVECVDTIWVHRGAIPPSTIKVALRVLREGSIIGMAPEGTRSPTGTLQRGKTGAAFLALMTNMPIVPVGIAHTEKLWANMLRFKRIVITVRFGQPYTPKLAPGQRASHEAQQEVADDLMCRIAALLPAEYHGVYAERMAQGQQS